MNKKAVFVLGPTASGKTKLSLKLAKKFNGEIVNIDSQQAIKYLNIGTDKIQKSEMEGIPHHMLDVYRPNKRINVFDYCVKAEKIIENIVKRRKLPVIVGGTGLYARILSGDWVLKKGKLNEELRQELEKLTVKELQKALKTKDKEKYKKMTDSDKKNKHRLIRQTEHINITDYTRVYFLYNYKILKLCKPILPNYLDKIKTRVQKMVSEGLILETEKIIKKYPDFETYAKAIGYKETIQYLKGSIRTKEELVDQIVLHTRQYARRQITWLKKEKGVKWVSSDKEAEKMVESFLSK